MSELEIEYTKLFKENNYTILDKIKSYPNDSIEYFVPQEAEVFLPKKLPNFNKINFLFGSYDSQYYDFYRTIGDVYFFPFYWGYVLSNRIKKYNLTYDFKSVAICMNFRPKLHRRLMMQELLNHEMLSKIKYSWKGCFRNNKIFELEDKTSLLSDNISQDNHREVEWNVPDEYYSTFIDIVNETFNDVGFITEKTLKPILLKKPFLVNTVPGFHRKLEEYGFKLYHNLFDYTFDSILDTEFRISEIVSQVSKWHGSDYNELYKLILPELEHNQKRLLEILINREYFPDIFYESKLELSKSMLDCIIGNIETIKNKL